MVVGGALLCPQGLGEISSKCTIPAHDKAVRGIGGEITRGSSPLLHLHIIQPPSDPPYLLSHPPQTIDFEEENLHSFCAISQDQNHTWLPDATNVVFQTLL